MSTVAFDITCSHPNCSQSYSVVYEYDVCSRAPEPELPATWTLLDGNPLCPEHAPSTLTAEEAAALQTENERLGTKVAELEATVNRMVRERL